jgi:MFS family permease
MVATARGAVAVDQPAEPASEAAPKAVAAHPKAPAAAPAGRGARLSQGLSQTFDALRVRDYRLLFQGNAVTSMGYWMQQAALGWLVLDLTDSPLYLGLASFARQFPMMIVSPFGGVLADRLDRRIVLIATQVSQLIFTAGLAALLVFGHINIWHVLIASFLMGCSVAVNVPARQALVPALVGRERLANALALYSMSLNASRIIGPSLAGVMMGWAGVAGCLILQSFGYLWAVINLFQIKYSENGGASRSGATVLQNLGDGLRYCVKTRPIFLQLLIAAVPTIVAYPYMQFLPSFARDVYGIGPGGLGLLMGAMGVGALLGSFAVAARRRIEHKGLLTIGCAALFGAFLCFFAMSPWLPAALLFLGLAGAVSAVYTTLNGTILQELTPDEYRGRVSSVYMVTWGMQPIGAIPMGVIAEFWGAPAAVFVGGAVCAVFSAALLAFRWRKDD